MSDLTPEQWTALAVMVAVVLWCLVCLAAWVDGRFGGQK